MSITLPTLTIPAPWWLTSNGRYHWTDRARRTRHIRDAATLTYTGHRAPGTGPWLIVAEVAYPTTAGDVDNSQPSVKAAIDGARTAGVILDDSPRYVAGLLLLRAKGKAPKGTHRITLQLTDQEVPW